MRRVEKNEKEYQINDTIYKVATDKVKRQPSELEPFEEKYPETYF